MKKRWHLDQVEIRAARALRFAQWTITDIAKAMGRDRKSIRRAVQGRSSYKVGPGAQLDIFQDLGSLED